MRSFLQSSRAYDINALERHLDIKGLRLRARPGRFRPEFQGPWWLASMLSLERENHESSRRINGEEVGVFPEVIGMSG